MKKLLASMFLALPLLALPSKAWAVDFGPLSVDAGIKYHFNVTYQGCNFSCPENVWCYENAGPWYLYWPYEAHSQTMAAQVFPYWPTPKTAATVRSAGNAAAYQPVAYYYYPRTTPNYWYGR
jgi:hypothetical protein